MSVTMVVVDKLAGECRLNKPLAADIHNTLGLQKAGLKIWRYAMEGKRTIDKLNACRICRIFLFQCPQLVEDLYPGTL